MYHLVAMVFCCLVVLPGPSALAQGSAASEGLNETFHTVTLSRGVDLNIVVSKRKDATPSVAALLFAGYPGILKIRNEAGNITYNLGGNFLVRARRHLNSDNVFTVLVDCPVDQWDFCDDSYRVSEQHASDVADVVTALKQKFGAKQAYIVGTSYGTVSSSFLAKNLGDRIDGAVHTATFTDPRTGARAVGVPMRHFDWSQAKVPQLFVHHKDDPCDVTRYSSVLESRKNLPLITVEGSRNPRGDACGPFSAHGFVGRERAVMLAIGDWIISRKVTVLISDDK